MTSEDSTTFEATAALLDEMRRLGVRLWLDGGALAYNAPRDVATPALLARLKAHKPDIVAFLRAASGPDAIEPVDRSAPQPLSFAQLRFWFLEQREGPSATFNMPGAMRLTGELRLDALRAAVDGVVERHASLRTVITVVDGEPWQVVRPDAPSALTAVDLTHLAPVEAEAEAERLRRQEASRPFDLAADVLVRVVSIALAGTAQRPTRSLLLITMHHIASDGWSLDLFARELSTLYRAAIDDRPSPLPELAIHYVDFASWQRRQVGSPAFVEQLDYWRGALAGLDGDLDLPVDRARSEQPTYAGATLEDRLPPALAEAVRALSKQHGATPYMTLLSAFGVLLMRVSGQDDICVGAPVAGRGPGPTQGLIGLFLQTVVMRVRLHGDPTFVELLERVKGTTRGAYAHQDAPFERIVELIDPERSLARGPLFQVMLNMPPPLTPPTFPGVEVGPLLASDTPAKYDLTIYVLARAGGYDLRLAYDSSLFDEARARALLAQYHALVEQAVTRPTERISALTLRTPRVDVALPDPRAPIAAPAFDPVPTQVARLAAEQGDTIAIERGARRWSYRALADCADVIAAALTRAGLTPGEPVAIHGLRSFGTVACMLGVMSAGGALVLLDPRLPAERRAAMLREGEITRIIQVGEIAAHLEATLPAPQMRVPAAPDDAAALADALDARPAAKARPVDPTGPAYIFFTSGSTGVPKGIRGRHDGLAHFLAWQRSTFEVGPGDRIGQLTALSFDVVLRDTLLPLVSGATLVLPPASPDGELAMLGGDRVLRWLDAARITRAHLVPTLVQSWLADAPTDVSLGALRTLFFAGEPLTDQLVRRWRAQFPDAGQIVNLYGPTETTLAKAAWLVSDPPAPGTQPVGRPLPQTQLLVMRGARLCGVGEAGEIVIRTPFRTDGYLPGSQGVSGTGFAPNPFRDDPDDQLYRTGDGGRYRPDGALEILGRLDGQLKIRGVRVEPGEVEALLNRQPGVRQAAVLAHGAGPDTRLVAFVVVQGDADPAAWSEALRARLPEVAVPALYIPVDAIPLNPNGKLDRRRLPPVEPERALRSRPPTPPSSPIEQRIAELWSEVLGRPALSVHDDFFRLGGHSLMATQVVARLRRALSVELSLRALFEHRTIAELARHIDGAGVAHGVAPAEPAGDDEVEFEW